MSYRLARREPWSRIGPGLQWATLRNLLTAWVLTLPVSMALAGSLYWLLRTLLG